MTTHLASPHDAVVHLDLSERAAQIALCAYLNAAHLDPIDDEDTDPRLCDLQRVLEAHMREWLLIAWDGKHGYIVYTQGTRKLEYTLYEASPRVFYDVVFGGDASMREHAQPGLYIASGKVHWLPGVRDYFEDATMDWASEEIRLATEGDLESMTVAPQEWQTNVEDCEEFDSAPFLSALTAQFPNEVFDDGFEL